MTTPAESGAYRSSNRPMIQFFAWAVAWVATLALARFGPDNLWATDQTTLGWAAIGLNLAVGAGWILAFVRYVQNLDELERKIVQDALLVTFGVAWIGWFAYEVAKLAGLIGTIEPNVFLAVLFLVAAIAYAAGKLRYR
jgi:hypothetical protein